MQSAYEHLVSETGLAKTFGEVFMGEKDGMLI